MHRFRRSSRGLAEIVGTLMLVVIVVAAATAFSFFVASYEKQVTAEESLSHEKSLENLRILALTPDMGQGANLSGLQIELASLDVNPIDVDGMILNGLTVVSFNVTSSSGQPLGPPQCLNGDPLVASNASCVLMLPAEAHEFISLDFVPSSTEFSFPPRTTAGFNESSLLEFELFTTLGNEFTESFVPPVAIAQVSFVNSFPILDGAGSYQPVSTGVTNVSVDLWDWNVAAPPENSPTSIVVGANTETGVLAFHVPRGYTGSSSEQLGGLTFRVGHAPGSISSGTGATTSVLSNTVYGGTDVVTFTYTYTATAGPTVPHQWDVVRQQHDERERERVDLE